MSDKKLKYVSLFSSAGIGCYGFKQENFECILTQELLEKRLDIQRVNDKCMDPKRYVPGDITDKKVWKKVIELTKNENIDVLIATPPCQGMSIANPYKNEKDIHRNSLVISAIDLIKEIKPKIFIFENVKAFLKTKCKRDNIDAKEMKIEDEINRNFYKDYSILN